MYVAVYKFLVQKLNVNFMKVILYTNIYILNTSYVSCQYSQEICAVEMNNCIK